MRASQPVPPPYSANPPRGGIPAPLHTFTPPQAPGLVTSIKVGGGAIYSTRTGKSWETAADGHLARFNAPGLEARYSPRGKLQFVRDEHRGITIQRQPGVPRQVVSVRPDHVQIVSMGPERGYVQHPYRPGFVRRTYIRGNDVTITVLREQHYRNRVFYRYEPVVRYNAQFYVWAESPWSRRVHWDWGYREEAWYQKDSSYFTPAGDYDSPSLWLVDYVLTDILRDADRAHSTESNTLAQGPSAGGTDVDATDPDVAEGSTVPITGLTETALTASVDNDLDRQSLPSSTAVAANTDEVPDVLSTQYRTFPIVTETAATLDGGSECRLGPADVIIRLSDDFNPDGTLKVTVASSRAGDCPSGANVMVGGDALQEQLNAYRQKIQQGLTELAAQEGAHGIPSGPVPDQSRTSIAPAPSPATEDAELIRKQEHAADQSESDIEVSGRTTRGQ